MRLTKNKFCLLLIIFIILINMGIVIYSNCFNKVKYNNVSTGVDYIEDLLLNEVVLKNGLVQTKENINSKIVNTGIRYVGSNPKNRVYFNCKDNDLNNNKYGDNDYDYSSSCEVWRIIGVFDVANKIDGSNKKRIKLIRDSLNLNMSWDSSSIDINNGTGINQWGESGDYVGADIMQFLNKYYIYEEETCVYCNESNTKTCTISCSNSIDPLSKISLNMIDDAVWYTGSIPATRELSLLTVYEGERRENIDNDCLNEEFCSDNVVRTSKWLGKIGLIYASDYAYASGDSNCKDNVYGSQSYCKNDNWLNPVHAYYRTISPVMYNPSYVWTIGKTSSMYDIAASYTYDIRPSLYLSWNVKIIDGNGDSEPYKLNI